MLGTRAYWDGGVSLDEALTETTQPAQSPSESPPTGLGNATLITELRDAVPWAGSPSSVMYPDTGVGVDVGVAVGVGVCAGVGVGVAIGVGVGVGVGVPTGVGVAVGVGVGVAVDGGVIWTIEATDGTPELLRMNIR